MLQVSKIFGVGLPTILHIQISQKRPSWPSLLPCHSCMNLYLCVWSTKQQFHMAQPKNNIKFENIFSKNVKTLSITQMGHIPILNKKWVGKVCAFSTWRNMSMKGIIPTFYTYLLLVQKDFSLFGFPSSWWAWIIHPLLSCSVSPGF